MTTENLFSAVLTLSLMAGGAVAFGSELGQTSKTPAKVVTATMPTVTVVGHRTAVAQVMLPTVEVTGCRTASTAFAEATLPTVTVIGRRLAPTAVAVETETVEQRVQ